MPSNTFENVLSARLHELQAKKDAESGYNWSQDDKNAIVLSIVNHTNKDVKNGSGKYQSYTGRFIILTALNKYGVKAISQFKVNTLVTAMRDYGITLDQAKKEYAAIVKVK